MLTIGLFVLFLLGWRQNGRSGSGLVFMTACALLAINSIFFVQNLPAGICSLQLGLLLLPYYINNRDAVLTAGGLVLINLLINIEVQTIVTIWLLFLTAGIWALRGFYLSFRLMKVCFTLLFSTVAFVLLLLNLWDGAYVTGIFLLVFILLFAAGMYRFSATSRAGYS